jgi:hypothetical protein
MRMFYLWVCIFSLNLSFPIPVDPIYYSTSFLDESNIETSSSEESFTLPFFHSKERVIGSIEKRTNPCCVKLGFTESRVWSSLHSVCNNSCNPHMNVVTPLINIQIFTSSTSCVNWLACPQGCPTLTI